MRTSQQHYRGLNNRFDRRAAQLIRFGFKYERNDDLKMSFFVRRAPFAACTQQTIPVAALHHADNRSWNDLLGWTLTRSR